MGVTYILFQIAVALLAIVTYYVYRRLSFFKRRGIPHDPPHLIQGNVQGLFTKRNMHEILRDYYNKYRESKVPFVGFYIFQKPAAFILDLELVKHILIKDFSNFSDKGLFYNEKDDPISAHLFSLDGPQWRILRNKLSSTFTAGKMKFMYPTVVSVADELITVMHEKVKKNASLEIRDLVSRFTVDVIGTCAFGIKCNSLRDENAEFLMMGKRSFVDKRHGSLLLAFMQSYPKLARRLRMVRTAAHIQEFYKRIVYETVAVREKENIKRNDFMDLLIEMKNQKVQLENGEVVDGLSIEEILAQAFVFFIAGFETSSSTMGYALYELARNPHIQDKVRAELEEVMEKHDQKFTYESTKDLKYLNQVIFETLRLYTIVPHLERKANKRFVVPDHPNFVIEAGQSVIIPSSAKHFDPNYYPEPYEFQPERFSPEETAKRPSVTWLPFGDGPRNCIGLRFGKMQALIGLALLIRNFRFSTCPETADPLVYNPKSFVLGVEGIQLKVEAV
ncbi:cytochrome P450 6a8 isoform X2 [Drosophila subobscura]|uniref:cytochrome P450 6a8 isoform X1 n=1 Tax=Drosophila subobscura TaxID=7241 RepID=UPI00155AE346|nr:cytochrome P450 6a8 isoform X1 [Drosophila subobscura]XP_034652026.1 cytochrome P450 6a8 isoform X2 [Drosophila subobscura]